MLFGWFAFTAAQVWARSAFALSSASVLYLVSYTDMICTTSGGVSRRRHELMESCSAHQSSTRPLHIVVPVAKYAHSDRSRIDAMQSQHKHENHAE